MATIKKQETKWLEALVLELRRIFPDDCLDIRHHKMWEKRDLPTISLPYFYWVARYSACPVDLLRQADQRNENPERVSVGMAKTDIGDVVCMKLSDLLKMIWRM